MKMTMTLAGQNIRYALLLELAVLATALIDKTFFLNAQTAAVSSFLIVLATNLTHKRMVKSRLQSGIYDDTDILQKIEDPHELFEENDTSDASAEELDLKEIVKEEKKRVKVFNKTTFKQGLKSSLSIWRVAAYLFLVLGFIALKNNGVLQIAVYLGALPLGIVAAYLVTKE